MDKHLNTLKPDEQCSCCGRFANRGITVDGVVINENNILLIKRGVEPFKDCWATPGGYVGWDETVEDAVAREIKEETGLSISEQKFVKLVSNPNRHPQQAINVVFLVKVRETHAKASDDAQEIRWFDLDNLPKQLAFDHEQNITDALKLL